MGHDQHPGALSLPLSGQLQGLLQGSGRGEEAHLRPLRRKSRYQDEMMLQRFLGQEGRLVTTELILPSKPLPALLRRARLTGPSLKDRMAQPLTALRHQDDASAG